jgi:mono/diheme cytochrome c family protein
MSLLNRWVVIGAGGLLVASPVLRNVPSDAVLRAQAVPAARVEERAPQPRIDFTREIQPIFKQYCAECHGPSKARGRLRLHTPDFILRGGLSGSPITPGNSEVSLLVRRVMGLDGEDQMPLDGEPLPEATIARLRAWIDQGAPMAGMPGTPVTTGSGQAPSTGSGQGTPDPEHWAYVKPTRPALPAVARADWAQNAIDRFVLARLEREKLSPSPDASKSALLRRVTLDLTGLPPSPAELDAFLADSAPGAYDTVVDRLLASPHYGERWARPWLDLARYADTNGHEKDNRRSIWKYRDWVIDALNRDLPFDQFTIEQIAGDMLPDATTEQRIATGFHRNAMTNEEGGVDPDESMYEVLVDRVNTTATVWLGSTLACAQCHNHKYDPFSQKDYFRLLAFFANPDYESRTSGDGTRFSEARLDLATPAQEKTRRQMQADIDRLEQELKTITPAGRDAQERWEQSIREADRSWTALAPVHASATNGVTLTTLEDGSLLASGPNPSLTSYVVDLDSPLEAITGLRLEALPDPSLPKSGPGRDGYGHFRVTGIHADIAPIKDPQSAHGPPRAVQFKTIKVDDSAYPFEPADILSPEGGATNRKGGSWAINAMRDKERMPRHAVLAAETPFGFPGGTRITVRIDHLDGTIGQGIGRFRLSATTASDPLVGSDLSARLRPVLALPIGERSDAQSEDLAAFFRSTAPSLKPARDTLAAARKALADLQIPSTLVMKERPSFERPSYELRERGSFTAKAGRVYARTPSALHAMREDLPVNRLGLARWLVDENNPLVARVAVNRFWEQIFGRGLVETSEDFGAQGAAPSHPELLDWLATEFMANKWSQKSILRTIVRSSTYRQSSTVRASLEERDPYNRLLARGPRVRMEAEMVRDAALAAGGLLSAKMYGPSVFPLQPDGIWNMPYNSDKWTTSENEDRYRRSLYTFWRRTSPYPSFMTFDATSREFCQVRRVRTNTPLQALTLLNDPASFEAARALAGRMIADAPAGVTTRSRAAYGVKVVLSREARADEVSRLVSLYEGERRHYEKRSGAAREVVGGRGNGPDDAADLAAWTIVANVLLNLDETVTKQ